MAPPLTWRWRASRRLWGFWALILLWPLPASLAASEPGPAAEEVAPARNPEPGAEPSNSPTPKAAPPAQPAAERPKPAPPVAEQPNPAAMAPAQARTVVPVQARPRPIQATPPSEALPPTPPPPVPQEQPSPARAQRPADDEDDFGRWERSAGSCEIQVIRGEGATPALTSCSRIRLDQQGPGQLSIRLLAAGNSGSSRRLILAGLLEPGSQPMRCRDTRCDPQWPLRVRLSALASQGLDQGNSPTALPETHLVQGGCQLDGAGMECQASDADQRWTMKARW